MSNALWSMALGLLLGGTVSAQTNVYKCVGGPHPVYQQTPCQGRAEWRWEVPVEPSLPRGAAAPESPGKPPARALSPPARKARGQAALITIASDAAACERARRQRMQVLGKGKRLDYVQRRQLDDAVHEACR